MIVSHIVAKTKNNVIGKNNMLPWKLPADIKYFKKITAGHVVIMGRKNFESEGKPLPDRINIIITRQKKYKASGCIIVHTIDHAIQTAQKYENEEAFIIGGGNIYKQTLSIVDKIYLTIIDIQLDGDVYYPEFNLEEWQLLSKRYLKKDQFNPFNHTYYVYQRIRK